MRSVRSLNGLLYFMCGVAAALVVLSLLSQQPVAKAASVDCVKRGLNYVAFAGSPKGKKFTAYYQMPKCLKKDGYKAKSVTLSGGNIKVDYLK